MAGKADWLARGLPREGENAHEARAVDVVRTDVVTCSLGDDIAAVRARVEASRYGFALVVSDSQTLLGRLRQAALHGDDSAKAEDVMEAGPSTVRADTPLDRLAERLDRASLHFAVVTNPDGRLLGVVRRADL